MPRTRAPSRKRKTTSGQRKKTTSMSRRLSNSSKAKRGQSQPNTKGSNVAALSSTQDKEKSTEPDAQASNTRRKELSPQATTPPIASRCSAVTVIEDAPPPPIQNTDFNNASTTKCPSIPTLQNSESDGEDDSVTSPLLPRRSESDDKLWEAATNSAEQF